MPHTHCPRCDATFYTPVAARVGPICPRCVLRGESITLLPARPRPRRAGPPRVFGSGGPAGRARYHRPPVRDVQR